MASPVARARAIGISSRANGVPSGAKNFALAEKC
jgi:hypothetical protein